MITFKRLHSAGHDFPPLHIIVTFVMMAVFALSMILLGFSASARSVSDGENAGPLDLSQYAGKVVYIDFWASWCGPCQESFPFMNKLKASYPEKDFVIVLVNVDRKQSKADRFLSRIPAPVPTLYDPKGKIARQFDIKAMPTSVLIDRKGRIRYVHSGYHAEKTPEYTSHIKELINENPSE